MTDIIYIEEQVADDPLTQRICDRYPRATRILCQHYGEIFNRKGQNFRLQKQNPALILARKQGQLIHAAPPGYGLGGEQHYYFSHMLNCVYDCRYCFLQGMYRSAHYVIFVNHAEFKQAIRDTLDQHDTGPSWFYSGYDCDSLALDPVTGFVNSFIPFFRDQPQARLELRSKSPHTRSLLQQQPLDNTVIAFSFTPDNISRALEHGVPGLAKRLDAILKLQHHGWNIGLRFDPLIYCDDFRDHYRALFQQLFSILSPESLHSVSLGSFRLPKPFFNTMQRLYPDDALLAGPLSEQTGMIGYHRTLEADMISFCSEELLRYIPESTFFPCYDQRDEDTDKQP
jgi:spore photoproduct lyase